MGIKAIEIVRKIRDRNYEVTKDMTTQEYLAYIRAKSTSFQNQCDFVRDGSVRATHFMQGKKVVLEESLGKIGKLV